MVYLGKDGTPGRPDMDDAIGFPVDSIRCPPENWEEGDPDPNLIDGAPVDTETLGFTVHGSNTEDDYVVLCSWYFNRLWQKPQEYTIEIMHTPWDEGYGKMPERDNLLIDIFNSGLGATLVHEFTHCYHYMGDDRRSDTPCHTAPTSDLACVLENAKNNIPGAMKDAEALTFFLLALYANSTIWGGPKGRALVGENKVNGNPHPWSSIQEAHPEVPADAVYQPQAPLPFMVPEAPVPAH